MMGTFLWSDGAIMVDSRLVKPKACRFESYSGHKNMEMKEFIEKLAKEKMISDVENTKYTLERIKEVYWSTHLNRLVESCCCGKILYLKHIRHQKLSYKKIYPNGDKIGGGNLLMFDVIWSDDKSLVPAAILGFPTNEYKNFKYRLLPKQLGEMYQYIYEV